MLGMKKYPKDYVKACRARVEADLRAYRKHAGKAGEEFEVDLGHLRILLSR